VRSPLTTFAGLLDRSVEEIAALVADARTVDLFRIWPIADIWDNNTFPLVSVACAPWPLRAARARAGLRWMADLGPARRELMVDLDPTLDTMLGAASPVPSVYRDYRGQVRAGSLPVTTDVVAGLEADYDVSKASVRSLAAWPSDAGLCARLTLAAPRRFVPTTGRVARNGSTKPWPPAQLIFTLTGVTELSFDTDDRIGVAIASSSDRALLAIGRGGHVRATSATVWPDDPCWHESTAGHAADTGTPHERRARRKPVPTWGLPEQQRAAARALVVLMLRIRLVGYYPELAGGIPVRELCQAAAGAGTAILAAGARRRSARRVAFAELEQRWRRVPPDATPGSIPAGPAVLRYARYDEPHEDFDITRLGQCILVVATPHAGSTAPWRLASEELAQPARFHLTDAAFAGVSDVHRDSNQLALGRSLAVQWER
jgi:hypothetical protein